MSRAASEEFVIVQEGMGYDGPVTVFFIEEGGGSLKDVLALPEQSLNCSAPLQFDIPFVVPSSKGEDVSTAVSSSFHEEIESQEEFYSVRGQKILFEIECDSNKAAETFAASQGSFVEGVKSAYRRFRRRLKDLFNEKQGEILIKYDDGVMPDEYLSDVWAARSYLYKEDWLDTGFIDILKLVYALRAEIIAINTKFNAGNDVLEPCDEKYLLWEKKLDLTIADSLSAGGSVNNKLNHYISESEVTASDDMKRAALGRLDNRALIWSSSPKKQDAIEEVPKGGQTLLSKL